ATPFFLIHGTGGRFSWSFSGDFAGFLDIDALRRFGFGREMMSMDELKLLIALMVVDVTQSTSPTFGFWLLGPPGRRGRRREVCFGRREVCSESKSKARGLFRIEIEGPSHRLDESLFRIEIEDLLKTKTKSKDGSDQASFSSQHTNAQKQGSVSNDSSKASRLITMYKYVLTFSYFKKIVCLYTCYDFEWSKYEIYALVAFFSVRGHQRLPPLILLFDFCSALPSFGHLSICVILWGKLRRGLSSSAPGDVDPRSGVLLWSGPGEAEASDGNGWALSSWSGRVVIRRVTLRCGVE
ncbi:unnamed protein product, partial [Brassica oleracea var. botrytis]